ncbi:hypothetical protein FHL15_007702 [Xylaria flabelliformis]|uniref:Uncharacterized protein n=1 Tax=Xylaria flabelliformis TaxID=2512241 RepID=A0A553HU56_9PEZI|nr:hypothetical protein FHL15_007702 [Xylaria flabelliformis]
MAEVVISCREKGERLRAELTHRLSLRDEDPPLPDLSELYELNVKSAGAVPFYTGPGEELALRGRPMTGGNNKTRKVLQWLWNNVAESSTTEVSYIDLDMLDYRAPVVLGTPNVEAIPRMLAKYAQKFEWKSIIRFRVFRDKRGQSRETDFVYHIRIDLSPPDKPTPSTPKRSKYSVAKQRRLAERAARTA